MLSFSHSSKGFTLVELMIVVAVIIILFGTSVFPYSYYMQRARVEKVMDNTNAEWILSHQDVRGGRLHDGASHAYVTIEMKKGDSFITYFTSTGGNSIKKEYKKYIFDDGIQILGFTGNIDPNTTILTYQITPPYATGSFSTGGTFSAMTGVIISLGYLGSSLESGKVRNMFLRPYFE